MAPKTAKLFKSGRSQAVRLPEEFKFEGTEVRIRRLGNGVLLEPATFDAKIWMKELGEYEEPFMPDGREQPPMPPDWNAVFAAIDAVGAPFMPDGREQPPMQEREFDLD